MLKRGATLTLTLLLGTSVTAFASDRPADANSAQPPLREAIARAAKDAESTITLWTLSQQPKRPSMLPVLYASYATLQVLDVVSTRKAIGSGAREANPVMRSGQVGTMLAAKAAAGASTMYFSEKLWKKNRIGAVVMMAALNGAT